MDEPTDIYELITSPENRLRNKGYKLLYMDEVINNFIKSRLASAELNDIESDDILHQGLVILQRRITDRGFKNESKVETYLTAICKNLIRSEIRKRGNSKMDSWGDLPEDGKDVFESGDTDNERQKERFEMLKKDIKKLRENCQQVLRDFYMRGLMNAEIAENRGLATPKQAKKLADRCRKYLRKITSENPFYKTH